MALVLIPTGSKSFPSLHVLGSDAVREDGGETPVEQVKLALKLNALRRTQAEDARTVAATALAGSEQQMNGLRQAAQIALVMGDRDALKRLSAQSQRLTISIEQDSRAWAAATRDQQDAGSEFDRLTGRTDPLYLSEKMRAAGKDIRQRTDQIDSMFNIAALINDLAARRAGDTQAGANQRDLSQRRAAIHNAFRSLPLLDTRI